MLRNFFRIKTLRNQCPAVTLAGPMIATAQTVDFEAINNQIVGGNAEAAYEQLRGLEDDLSGNVQFDYLLGLAALESGNPQAASFALERALTVDPNFIAARFAMARALYASGTYDLAKAEFETLNKLTRRQALDLMTSISRPLRNAPRRPSATTWRVELDMTLIPTAAPTTLTCSCPLSTAPSR